jgi:putative oxidoreductase
LLRLAVGIALASHAVMALRSGPLVGPTVLNVLAGVVGILLLIGLWTPVAGTLLAVVASLSVVMHPADPWNSIFLGALGAGLALVGPGAWSVDAYLFGWIRI